MFSCSHCQVSVPIDKAMGTHNRNHCPKCLWSKHVDDKNPGDRGSNCHGDMQPVGLTFKSVRPNRYGQPKTGELMLIHDCITCHKISINRIAADDDPLSLLSIFQSSLILPQEAKAHLEEQGIALLSENDSAEIKTQLQDLQTCEIMN